MTTATTSVAPRPKAFGALSIHGYRAYLVTFMLAMMADNIEHVISYWVAFQKFHSPALGGFAVRLALAAVPALLRRRRRAERPLRLAADHPGGRGALHHRLGRVGLLLRHRHASDVARDGAARHPRLRGRALDDVEPDAALRHRRARARCRAPCASTRRRATSACSSARPWAASSCSRSARRAASSSTPLFYLPLVLWLVARAVRASLPGRPPAAEARRARPRRHRRRPLREVRAHPGARRDDRPRRRARRSSSATATRRRCRASRTISVTAIPGTAYSDAAGRRRRRRAPRRVPAREPRGHLRDAPRVTRSCSRSAGPRRSAASR